MLEVGSIIKLNTNYNYILYLGSYHAAQLMYSGHHDYEEIDLYGGKQKTIYYVEISSTHDYSYIKKDLLRFKNLGSRVRPFKPHELIEVIQLDDVKNIIKSNVDKHYLPTFLDNFSEVVSYNVKDCTNSNVIEIDNQLYLNRNGLLFSLEIKESIIKKSSTLSLPEQYCYKQIYAVMENGEEVEVNLT